jgi:hypothetical protein
MSRRMVTFSILNCALILGVVYTAGFTASAQQPAKGPEGAAKAGKGKGPARPPLFFREEWKTDSGRGRTCRPARLRRECGSEPKPGGIHRKRDVAHGRRRRRK